MESNMCQNEWKGPNYSDKGGGPLISKQMTCGAPKWLWGHKNILMDLQVDRTTL